MAAVLLRPVPLHAVLVAATAAVLAQAVLLHAATAAVQAQAVQLLAVLATNSTGHFGDQ